ncbi:MAG: hypothetical protein ACM3ZQ_02865 [Bacillota bacterium]
MLRSDQLGRLQRIGDQLRGLGYYRFQINEMVADLLGPNNIEEMDPAEGELILARLELHVSNIAKEAQSR